MEVFQRRLSDAASVYYNLLNDVIRKVNNIKNFPPEPQKDHSPALDLADAMDSFNQELRCIQANNETLSALLNHLNTII